MDDQQELFKEYQKGRSLVVNRVSRDATRSGGASGGATRSADAGSPKPSECDLNARVMPARTREGRTAEPTAEGMTLKPERASASKALTLYQPWGWLMLYGPKRIENRDWAPWPGIVGTRIWVHQGKKWDAEGAAYIKTVLPELVFPDLARTSGILGSFHVARVLDKDRGDVPPLGQEPWFFGRYGWLTSDPLVLGRPVLCKGALGLWNVPEELAHELGWSEP